MTQDMNNRIFIVISNLKLMILSGFNKNQQLQYQFGVNEVMKKQYPLLFPSFAASPRSSPSKDSSSNQHEIEHPQIHKISIHLPQSLVESTIDQNFSIESYNKEVREDQNIKVYCRFRPSKNPSSIKYDETMVDDGENSYSFDTIFGKFASQKQVYNSIASRHIESFYKGQNSTIFTYGQTGSGKTYTMFGNLKQREHYGLIPRTLEEIFLKKPSTELITCSILQIYNQKLIDLFDPLKQAVDAIKLKEINDIVYLQGLVEVTVQNHEQIMQLIKFGYRDRKIASTHNNDCSSRSHTILFVYRTYHSQGSRQRNKICFIDLAGSEKIRKSGVKGQNLEETKKINLSLSCLGNVVFALTTSSEHIPYRNSKLTRILKDSLSGTSKTSIITTCSLQKSDLHETISTIKFAVRAKKIKNKKRLSNTEFTMEQVIQNLKKQLALTKKELEYYKRKDKEQHESKTITIMDIPQEDIICQPINFSCLNGGVGVLSRIKMISTNCTQ